MIIRFLLIFTLPLTLVFAVLMFAARAWGRRIPARNWLTWQT
ncbi:MAG: hypothetical protein U0694_17450 [Anaerolineae bacterium]